MCHALTRTQAEAIPHRMIGSRRVFESRSSGGLRGGADYLIKSHPRQLAQIDAAKALNRDEETPAGDDEDAEKDGGSGDAESGRRRVSIHILFVFLSQRQTQTATLGIGAGAGAGAGARAGGPRARAGARG